MARHPPGATARMVAAAARTGTDAPAVRPEPARAAGREERQGARETRRLPAGRRERPGARGGATAPPPEPPPPPRDRARPGARRAPGECAGARQARAGGEKTRVRAKRSDGPPSPPTPTLRSSPPNASGGRGRGRRTARTRAHAREQARQTERASARAHARDKPLCRGLTFNRSQRGSCSATYETPTQKQVVYEWFSARFPTNVRSVTGERAASFPAAPRFPGRGALRTGPRSRRAAGTRRPRAGSAGERRPRAGGDERAGDRLSEANRGSFGAAVSFRLGGILT